jgi:hypothetical protein
MRESTLTQAGRLAIFLAAFWLGGCAQNPVEQTLWRVDSLERIGGFPVTVLGDPQVIDTPFGNAVAFDGDGDRILVPHNPLGDTTEFTVEILFRANDAYPANVEPRFFHIEAPDNPDRRITIELRLNDRQQWYLDTYIKSELFAYTLIDETLVHPVGEWAHAAITYSDRQFSAYVNGVKELTAEVDYLPIGPAGQSSIGARMNQVHWFNGDILAVRITHKALPEEEFMSLEDFRVR